MYVVDILGSRYLWVDCLCIVQDDEDELKQNIHQMQHIFSQAEFTIVAANGDDANAGLPVIFAWSRHILPASTVLETIRHVAKDNRGRLRLDKTVWGSRAWTYQEYEFSDRLLIFANQSFYYECRKGTFYRAPLKRVGDGSFKIRNSLWSQPIWRYESHVEDYSNRKLTYPDDILNAFMAIMEDESAQSGTKFCWGLPIQNFSRALLWRQQANHNRKDVPFCRRSYGCNMDFPSWTWAEWIGGVQYDLSDTLRPIEGRVRFVIAWPWEAKYDLQAPTDPFTTGILHIRAQIAVVELAAASPLQGTKYFEFDLGVYTMTHVQCILLGIVEKITAMDLWEVAGYTHLAIAVEQDTKGIYRRIGRLRIGKATWDASKPTEQVIELG
ncbi:heterokaryon incompatibility protein-domain-containing protein [Paraphoma chrysanthemicola]|uniref:Heterokaryon incompatibility protein-domain-containing protein n=1 Tax=Paraphoma chrysanthemicola TaxID=798071 RepID=A0A8K0RAP7_9PLEO|nr:heterokaryon incompatibility protein-domain-containing protein [Paraphoma chrysanthemicola]